MNRRGRPRKELGAELPEPVRLWADALWGTVFGPLMSGEGRLTLEEIAERLEAMIAEKADGSRGAQVAFLHSGRGETSVQRMRSGRLVPTRDVVYDLLRLVAEERSAPDEQAIQALWTAHMPALRMKRPETFAFYEILDDKSALQELTETQRARIAQLEGELRQSRELLGVAHDHAKRAQRAKVRLRRALTSAKDKSRELLSREEALQKPLEELSAEVAELELDLVNARNTLADWQRLANLLRDQHEQAVREAAEAAGAWAQREAALLKRLSDACSAMEDAASLAQQALAALRWQEQWHRQQMDAANAATQTACKKAEEQHRLALSEQERADAVQIQAVTILQKQQASFDEFANETAAQHAHSMRTIKHLEDELRQTRTELRQARQSPAAQTDDRLDAFLAERDLLQELDAIISLALAKHRAPGPPALTRFAAAPASQQMSSTPAPLPSTAPDETPAPGAAPKATAAHEEAKPRAGEVYPSPAVLARRAAFAIVAVAGTVALGMLLAAGCDRNPDANNAGRRRDVMATLGKQPVNTTAVMRLPPCKDGYTTWSLSAKPSYAPDAAYEANEEPVFVFTVTGRTRCRINAVHDLISVRVQTVSSGATVWDSGSCTHGRPADRWIAVSRTPATLTYIWDRTSNAPCASTKKAPAGKYTVTAHGQLLTTEPITGFEILAT
ncbi:hypothetical protein ACFV2Z_38410 [Streptomyces sp. NPDC059688]|uniref:hypothetical protein n=1 Tax=Streptomyces sp. NPDC059688 TaxID=3346906 RepID=UPI0036ACDD65